MFSLLCVWHFPGEPVANRMPHNSSENKIQRKSCVILQLFFLLRLLQIPHKYWNGILSVINKTGFCTKMSHVFNEGVWVRRHYRNNTSHTKFKAELCAVVIANSISHHETVLNSVLEEVHHRSMHWSLLGSH